MWWSPRSRPPPRRCPAPIPAARKVSRFAEFPGKGRATGGVRAHTFLKGEVSLALAWVGPAPALAVGADGAARTLPESGAKRDASGAPLDAVVGSIGRRSTPYETPLRGSSESGIGTRVVVGRLEPGEDLFVELNGVLDPEVVLPDVGPRLHDVAEAIRDDAVRVRDRENGGEVAGLRPGGVHTQAKPRRRENPTWVLETLTSAPPRLSSSSATRL